MSRLQDLENPLKQNSPIFLDPRPDPKKPDDVKKAEKKIAKVIPAPMSEEETNRLKDEYRKNIGSPATTTWKTFSADAITEVVAGKAWVVPDILTEEECDELVRVGDELGMEGPKKYGEETENYIRRTSKRTTGWTSEALSTKVKNRLSEDLLDRLEGTAPYTSVRGLHPNWRIACYQEGETFPAHFDQADSVMVEHPTKKRQRFTSSHTLLIYLRKPDKQFQGGATRLFVDGNYTGHTVDVFLPQGYGLVFQQRGLLHAGLPVTGPEQKYIAQAGVLRGEPDGVLGQCSVFKYGPGLGPY